MRATSTKLMVELASKVSPDVPTGIVASLKNLFGRSPANPRPITRCAAGAVEVGVVVPSALERRLTDAGFLIGSKPGDGHGIWLDVRDGNGAVVARGFGPDRVEALLAATLGAMKEEAALPL